MCLVHFLFSLCATVLARKSSRPFLSDESLMPLYAFGLSIDSQSSVSTSEELKSSATSEEKKPPVSNVRPMEARKDTTRVLSDETVMSLYSLSESVDSDSSVPSISQQSASDESSEPSDTAELEKVLEAKVGPDQKIELNEDHEPIRIYYNKKDALRVFHTDVNQDIPGRGEFLFAYHNVCMAKPQQPPPWYKRKIFVVVESNNMTGRDMLARELARQLRALYLTNPPTCLGTVRKYFIGTPLEGAFRALGMYASAYHTRLIWNVQPVVMTGYWFDQTSYIMVVLAGDESLPKDESPLFNWPRDLTCPDIMFYVHYDVPVPRRELNKQTPNAYLDLWDESYQERQRHKRLAKVYEKLSYMGKPLLFRIHTKASNTSRVLPQMQKHIMDELYIKFNFKIKFYDE